MRNELVHAAVQFLMRVEMSMAMEYERDRTFHQEPVDGHGPPGAMLRETFGAVGILSAPLVERGRLGTATVLIVRAAHEVVDKHELELRPAAFKDAFEPLVLSRFPECVPYAIEPSASE